MDPAFQQAMYQKLQPLDGRLCQLHNEPICVRMNKDGRVEAFCDGAPEGCCARLDLLVLTESLTRNGAHAATLDEAPPGEGADGPATKADEPDQSPGAERKARSWQDEIRRIWRVCVRSGMTEIRIILGPGRTASGYFNDVQQLIAALESLPREWRAAQIYFVLNTPNPALFVRAANRIEIRPKATTADHDIVRCDWLLIDLDCELPANVSSTNAEHRAALERAEAVRQFLCNELDWPGRGLVPADSGNGAHLLALIDRPNNEDEKQLRKRMLDALAFRFSRERVNVDQTTFNPARITKLYGVIARKGDNTAERPHRQSRLLEVPESVEVVPLEALERLAALAPPEEPRRTHSQSRGTITAEEFIAKHGIAIARQDPYNGGTRYVLRDCQWNSEHTNQSAFIIQFASGALAAGCQHNGCAGKGWRDLRELFEPGYLQRREQVPVLYGPDRELAATPKTREMPTAAGFLAAHRKRISRPVVVQRLLLAGTFSMMLGRPFGGKSSCAAALTLKVHQGGEFLGRKCTKSKVGYFALERSGVGVAELFEKWGIAEEVQYEGEIPAADAPAFIERRIREHNLQFVVVDHLQHAARIEQGNDYANVSNALAPFQRIAAETGCCLLVLHHQRKPQQTDNQSDSSGDIEALGSDAYRAASETLLECSKWRDTYFVRAQTRGLTNLGKMRVVIDFETGEVEMGDVREEEREAAAKAIADYLAANGGQTEKEIRAKVRGHAGRTMTEALRDSRKFRREGKGGQTDPFRYFVLVVPDPLLIQPEQRLKNIAQTVENTGESVVRNNTFNFAPNSASEPHQTATSVHLCSSLFGTEETLDISSTFEPNNGAYFNTPSGKAPEQRNQPEQEAPPVDKPETTHSLEQQKQSEQSKQEAPNPDDDDAEIEVKV